VAKCWLQQWKGAAMIYKTELCGDGQNRIWAIDHNLRDDEPTVTLEEITTHDRIDDVSIEAVNDQQILIEFRHAPRAGLRYEVLVSSTR
jgi:hypothetical protein